MSLLRLQGNASKATSAAFLAGLAGAGSLAGISSLNAGIEKPNIVIIIADDLGYGDVGVHGCKDIPTPNIDSIARNGVLFTNGYVSGPVCSPTRAALMSGQYQQRHGDEELTGKPTNKDGLSLSVTTLPQRLKTAGYVTGAIGKWHLGEDKDHHPLMRGFDEFYGFLSGGRSYHPMTAETLAEFRSKPIKGDARIYRGWQVEPDPAYTTDAFGEEAVRFIERHKEEPFFLYWASQAPHAPVQPCERLIGKFSGIEDKTRREYASMVAAMDEAVGRILDAIKTNGLESNTLVFFLSDNGGPISLTGNGSTNGPLRGEKFQTWEGGVHVPFLAQWKGTLPAGDVYKNPVIQLDITATALALAGLKPGPDWRLDGVNLMPFLTGENKAPPHEALYFRLGKNIGIRKGDLKMVDSTTRHGDPQTSGEMLFDLNRDMGEKSDLKGEQPDALKEMDALFRKWSSEVDGQARENRKLEPPFLAPTSEVPEAKKSQTLSKSDERAAARKAARQAAKTSVPAPAGP